MLVEESIDISGFLVQTENQSEYLKCKKAMLKEILFNIGQVSKSA